jgi:hypothetical protein
MTVKKKTSITLDYKHRIATALPFQYQLKYIICGTGVKLQEEETLQIVKLNILKTF